jgi:uncharacterized Ntn-hydrolase superfamily protein
MTYSIVARDPLTGELGVAVQTRYFGAGSGMPWAEPGVAVATQAFTEERYGPLGLALMRGGLSAPDALRALLAGDDGVSAQANMMERETVWDAMVAAYRSAEGSLAERLLAASWRLNVKVTTSEDVNRRRSSSSAALDKIHRGSGRSTFGSMTIPIP